MAGALLAIAHGGSAFPIYWGFFVLLPLAFYPTYLVGGGDPNVTVYLRHYLGLPFVPNGQVWFLWQLLALNIIAASVYWLAPGILETLGKWSVTVGRRPAVYFITLLAISAVAYVPLALAFTPWEWSNSGIFSIQWCRPLLYSVYFFAGVGIGTAGVDVGLVAIDGELGRRWKLWLVVALGSLFLWMGVTALTMNGPVPVVLNIAAALCFVLACAGGSSFLISSSLRFGLKRSWLLDSLSINAYSLYLVHYGFGIWLQFALLGFALFALAKGFIVFAATLALSWITILVVQRIPLARNSSPRRRAPRRRARRAAKASSQRQPRRLGNSRNSSVDVGGDMRAQDAPTALGEHLEVARGLRRLDHAEARTTSRNGEIVRRPCRDLKKNAGVRPALVGLPGRMQEARPKLQTRRGARSVADGRAQALQRREPRGCGIEIGDEREVIAVTEPREVRLEPAFKRGGRSKLPQRVGIVRSGVKRDAVFLEHRLLRRKRAGFLESVGHCACCELARFHVRLVERIDAEDRRRRRLSPSRSGRTPERLSLASEDGSAPRVPAALQRIGGLVLRGIRFALVAEINEQPVGAVGRNVAERFVGDWNDAVSQFLPVDSATSCSIHAPNAAMRGEAMTVSLSRPLRARTPIARPSDTPGFSAGGVCGPQAFVMAAASSRKARTS